jgi:metallo-beta-lactamase class B
MPGRVQLISGVDPVGECANMVADICIHPWDYWVEPFRIAGGLYYVGNKNVSSHLLDTGEGLILLDTAFPQTVYLLLEAIRRLGFDPDDLHTILHCHGHYDHFGGTRALVELTGARTAMGKDDAFILTERPELSWAAEYGVKFHETFALDVPLRDGQTITLGDTKIHCIRTPGHTPGAMSYLFELCDGGKKYTAGIHGGPGLNTLTDDYLTKYDLPYEARRQYVTSLGKLGGRDVDIFIGAHPGQNDTFGKRERMTDARNPFIDKGAWAAFLSRLRANAEHAFGTGDQGMRATS